MGRIALLVFLSGGVLVSIGLLIFVVSKKKGKRKALLNVILVTGMSSGLASSVQAIENQLLIQYNQEYQLSQGDSLPLPRALSGYTYLGYIKQDKEINQQETAARDQKLDYTVQPHFQANEGGQRQEMSRKLCLQQALQTRQSLLKIYLIKSRLVLLV